ncbi:MAG: Spy/CpxP family protein refolding chaperone [Parvibaculum sp.]|jgi:hypothetical protein|nr:Spy/CpxP family protein refolding chaperone [Parvibaculum sp.]
MRLRNVAFSVLVGFTLSALPAAAAPDGAGPQGWGHMMMQGWGGQNRGMMGWPMMGGSWNGPGMMMNGGCGMMDVGSDGSDVQTYIDGRIAFLQAELKTTKDQQAAWSGYADALRANTDVMVSMHRQMRMAFQQQDRTPVQWLDVHIGMMKSRLAALENLKPATEALYKVLTPEQRQRADRLLPVMGCM